jgi:hypothetical protein
MVPAFPDGGAVVVSVNDGAPSYVAFGTGLPEVSLYCVTML